MERYVFDFGICEPIKVEANDYGQAKAKAFEALKSSSVTRYCWSMCFLKEDIDFFKEMLHDYPDKKILYITGFDPENIQRCLREYFEQDIASAFAVLNDCDFFARFENSFPEGSFCSLRYIGKDEISIYNPGWSDCKDIDRFIDWIKERCSCIYVDSRALRYPRFGKYLDHIEQLTEIPVETEFRSFVNEC